MDDSRIYEMSFKIGIAVQVLLTFIFLLKLTLLTFLSLSFLNMICSLFIYPIVLVFLNKTEWSRIPPGLGPHQ